MQNLPYKTGHATALPKCKPLSFGQWLLMAIAITLASMLSMRAEAATSYPNAETARFEVSVTGTGPDILLIPGLGCSKDVWEATVETYKSKYRLHVINIAGFAGVPSGANTSGPVIPPSVEALHAYIQSQDIKPIIIGHSMGGLMGLMLAKDHPEDISSLIIVDAFPFIGIIFDPNATVETIRPQAESFKQGILNSPPEAFAAQQRATAQHMSTSAQAEAIARWTIASDRKIFAQAMYDDMTIDLRADLKSIQTPTLVLYPYHSKTGIPKERTEFLYKNAYANMPNVTLKLIDNSLHFIMLDQPEAFFESLDSVLK